MHSVKTTTYDQSNNMQWYLHIFKVQKVQSPAKRFKELFSLSESLSMKWNHCFWGLTMFVYNFGVGSLEQSVKLGWLVIWFPWQFPSLNTNFSKPTTKKQCFFSVFIVWAVFQLQWQKKTYLKHRPLFCLQIFKFSNFVATSKAHIWLAVCEFLWLLTNQNVWFVTFFALN